MNWFFFARVRLKNAKAICCVGCGWGYCVAWRDVWSLGQGHLWCRKEVQTIWGTHKFYDSRRAIESWPVGKVAFQKETNHPWIWECWSGHGHVNWDFHIDEVNHAEYDKDDGIAQSGPRQVSSGTTFPSDPLLLLSSSSCMRTDIPGMPKMSNEELLGSMVKTSVSSVPPGMVRRKKDKRLRRQELKKRSLVN